MDGFTRVSTNSVCVCECACNIRSELTAKECSFSSGKMNEL